MHRKDACNVNCLLYVACHACIHIYSHEFFYLFHSFSHGLCIHSSHINNSRVYLALSNSSKSLANIGSFLYWSKKAFFFFSWSYCFSVRPKSSAMLVWFAIIRPETWPKKKKCQRCDCIRYRECICCIFNLSYSTYLVCSLHVRALP